MKKLYIPLLIVLTAIIGIWIYAKEPNFSGLTEEELKWQAFTSNLIAIQYDDVEILAGVSGIWEPTEEEFEDIYEYVYGTDMVNWQSIDGTERCVDEYGNRSNCIEHWEEEYNRAIERGELEEDVLGGLRDGVRENMVNSDIYDTELQAESPKKKFGWWNWIKSAFAGVEFEDHFTNDGGDVPLKDWTPDTTGTGWTDLITVELIGGCDLDADANLDTIYRGTCGSSEGELCETDDTMSGTDYQVDIYQANGDVGDNPDFIACRIQDANNMYALYWNEATSTLFIRNGGSWSILDNAGAGIADGSTVTLKCIGSTISVEDDDAEIMSASDSTHSSAGKAGVGMGAIIIATDDVSGQILDDFVVTVSAAAPSAVSTEELWIKDGTLWVKSNELQIK